MKKPQAKVNDVRELLAKKRGIIDINSMRPYIGEDELAYIAVHKGGDKADIKNYNEVPVANAALRYDEWRQLDDAIVRAGRQRLIGFDDLRKHGLVYNLNNPMATTVLTYERMSEALSAAVSISPSKKADNDIVDFEAAHLPIPIAHSDFTLDERILQESRTRGNGLDTVMVEAATRAVMQQQEDMLFGSTSSLTYGGGVVYTYITEPNINTASITAAWDASSTTGAVIRADVLKMKQASIDDYHFGPWILYIPPSYDTVMDDDYSVSGASLKTIRERILDIDKILDVRVVDRLADDTCLLVQMTSDVVDLVDGMAPQVIQWDSDPFSHNYKVMSIQIPRVKSDYNDRSGIVKLA